MKKITIFVILTIFILDACGTSATPASEPTLLPSPTNTLVLTPTETSIPPTETLEPTPTSIPTPTFTPVPLCDVNTRPSDDSLIYYINSYNTFYSALCLPNGNKLVLAYEKKHPTKISIYVVNPDSKLTKLEKPSEVTKQFAHLLFVSPDGKKLYWMNSVMCGNRTCREEYYVTNLDDSEQKRIFMNANSAQDIYLSPSGQYISYIDNSFQQLHGCFIYNATDGTSTKLVPELNYCFGENHWSPKEDKLYSKLYVKTKTGNSETGYSVLNVPTGETTTFSTNWVSWDDYYKNPGTN